MKRFVAGVRPSAAPRLWGSPRPEHHLDCDVSFRGYVANRGELAATLHARGLLVDRTADASLLAGAYRLWGAGLQAHVLGEYALAIFDRRDRQLVLTHDGLGVQPLFYTRTGHALIAASHLDELLRVIDPPALDEAYIREHLLLGRHAAARTPYQGVARLQPGATLLWRDGGQDELRRTWDLRQAPPVACGSDDEYDERFRSLLADAVRAALPPDGKAWAELSGGLDSSSIVSMAARLGHRDLDTFSFIYSRSAHADERPWIRRVLRKTGYRSHTVDMDAVQPFSRIPSGVFGDPNSAIPYDAARARYEALAAEAGVGVVLSGNGGDHVLLGEEPDPVHLADKFLRLEWRALAADLARWQASDEIRRPLRFHLWRHVVGPALRHYTGRVVMPRTLPPAPDWIDARFARPAMDCDGSTTGVPIRCGRVGDQHFVERVWLFAETNGTNMSQCVTAFEFRYPLLYRPLVEFMFAVPWDEKLRPGLDRRLQRRALAGILPEATRQRRDKGGPDQAVFDGLRHSAEWQSILTDAPRLVERGFVDPARWRHAVHQARFANVRPVSLFIQAAMLEWWLRHHDTRPRPDLRSDFEMPEDARDVGDSIDARGASR